MNTRQNHYLYLPIWRDCIPRTPIEQRARTIERLIGLWCDLDCSDDVPLQVVQDTFRPDLTVDDVRLTFEHICDLSIERADRENDGPAEAYEAATDEYEAALGDLASRPADLLMTMVDSVYGRPVHDVQLPENVHSIRRGE
jgi:hypothetical protein